MSELADVLAEVEIADLKADLRRTQKALKSAAVAVEAVRSTSYPKVRKARTRMRKKKQIVEVIISDVHGDEQDPAAVAACLADVTQINPDRVMLLGDILNGSGFISGWAQRHLSERMSSFAKDAAAANAFLDALQEAAPNAEIHFIGGNHEQRLEAWIVGQGLNNDEDVNFMMDIFGPEKVLRLEERGITYYAYNQIHDGLAAPGWVGPIENLYFCHKISLAKNAADAALAATVGNVVFGDSHRLDMKVTRGQDGVLRGAWNSGCLCKISKPFTGPRVTGWTHSYLIRYIDRRSGHFQVVPVLIENGESLGSMMFNKK